MRDVFGAKYVSLHVRETNRAAIGLYRDTLGFEVHGVEKGYCELSLAVVVVVVQMAVGWAREGVKVEEGRIGAGWTTVDCFADRRCERLPRTTPQTQTERMHGR